MYLESAIAGIAGVSPSRGIFYPTGQSQGLSCKEYRKSRPLLNGWK